MIFECLCLFGLLNHNILPAMIAVHFDSVAHNIRTEVLILMSNASEKWWSDFIALGFLKITDWLGDIVLLSVNPSLLETIADLIMSLYYFWSTHFPEDLYNFLMFSRHICSYITQLLNYWSTPMATICYFSCYDYNTPLIITYFCSTYSIEIIVSKTFFSTLDFENFFAWAVPSSLQKQRYSFPYGGGLWHVILVVIYHWYFSVSDTNLTLMIYAVALWLCFLGVAK